MYCGTTISDSPKQVTGDLHTNGNAESYIEFIQNGVICREEVFPSSVYRIDKPMSIPQSNPNVK